MTQIKTVLLVMLTVICIFLLYFTFSYKKRLSNMQNELENALFRSFENKSAYRAHLRLQDAEIKTLKNSVFMMQNEWEIASLRLLKEKKASEMHMKWQYDEINKLKHYIKCLDMFMSDRVNFESAKKQCEVLILNYNPNT